MEIMRRVLNDLLNGHAIAEQFYGRELYSHIQSTEEPSNDL